MNTKPAIIILHGWGLSSSRFAPLADVLRGNGFEVYVPDLPGFGQSKLPVTALYLKDYADFLKSYMAENKIQMPVIIGHSFGGRVALKFNYIYPGSLSGIIFTGTPGFTPVPKKKLSLFIAVAKIGKVIVSVWPLSKLEEKIRQWYYYLVGARDYYRAQGVMRDIFKHIVQEDISGTITSVRVPCALIWGEEDSITPVWIAEKMHTLIDGSVLEIIHDADHGVSYKKPQVFVPYVNQFYKTL